MANSLASLFSRPTPETKEDWAALDYRAADIFSPHAPIDEEQLFDGRMDLVEGLVETIFQRGQHAILYGERGVGKTSLCNILKDKIFARSKFYSVTKRSCTAQHDYRRIWSQLFDHLLLPNGQYLSDTIHKDTDAYDIFKAVDQLPTKIHPIFVVDEYDRVLDADTHVKMADTIKYFSDYSSKATLVIVGVARDVKELFGGHPSIERNVRQLPMPLMSKEELSKIFEKRLPDLGMTIDVPVRETLIKLAQGLPGYTHLLGQNAARSAIRRRSLNIAVEDLNDALKKSIDQCDEKIKELYANSVRSTKPLNQYRQALLACALAPIDDRGYFAAADVKGPFSRIMGKPLDIPHYARHLNEFCDLKRGPSLVKVGQAKSYQFRFADALLRPFVVIKGINEGLIEGAKI
jgi:Cdc6-like AAA superfamily ATPase